MDNQKENNPKNSFEEIKKDQLLSQEAKEILTLNQEISSIIGTNEQKTQEVLTNLTKPQRIISNRGFEVFNYSDLKKEYDTSTPVLRDFNLPLCKSIVKSHFKFWMIFSPFLGGSFYTIYHLSKIKIF